MSGKKIFLLGVISAIANFIVSVHAEEIPPFGYPPFSTLSIHANSNNKDYELYIQLPPSYSDTKATYPLIIVNDSRFAFPVTNGAMALMGNNVVKEAIVVGVSYARGEDRTISRTRDYTPTYSPGEPNGHSAAARKASGHAKEYVTFLADQVIPLLQKNYRIDANNKVFVGHSFGGLLGSYILVNRPELFDHYIIGSPSLWYDDKVIFKMEAAYAKNSKSLNAHVMIYADDDNGNPNNQKMAEDVLAFEKVLRSRNYSGLNLKVEIIKGENHHSVFPGLLSRGLMAAIPLKK
ncbi:MAG: alpha/beta hydrolase-fold protein [Cellvibrio sp.]|uniref:alpha/beta hydrolase n=1 Tax=Cellvibrio sp. TaxID=1965322 RepID=UPI0031A49E3F